MLPVFTRKYPFHVTVTKLHDMNMIFPKALILSTHTTLYDMNN